MKVPKDPNGNNPYLVKIQVWNYCHVHCYCQERFRFRYGV